MEALPSLVRRLSPSVLSRRSLAVSTKLPFWISATNFTRMGAKLSLDVNRASDFAPLPETITLPVFALLSAGGDSSPTLANVGLPHTKPGEHHPNLQRRTMDH